MIDITTAPLNDRQRALIEYAIKLTVSSHSVTENDLASLRAVGITDAGIHDVVAIIAYFNFVNRLALGLGVQLEDQ